MSHRWHFFRAGGVDQVSLRDQDDLKHLTELDQKLWVALAMPTQGIDIDPETLAVIDTNNDGRIRVRDILDNVAWAADRFVHIDGLLRGGSEVQLAAFKDDKLVAAAKRMLKDLGKPDADAIGVADANAINKAFADTVLNGDGIVIAESAADDGELVSAINDVIACGGSVTDRSGKPGVDKAKVDAFFDAVDKRIAWIRAGTEDALLPAGAGTAAASDALRAVAAKLDDYFARCRVAAFDTRGAAALGATDAEIAALSPRSLTETDDELGKLPLARIDPEGKLPLDAINPAWAARIATFVTAAVTPLVGERATLTAGDVAEVTGKLAAYEAWRGSEPTTMVDKLDPAWLLRLSSTKLRAKLFALIEADAALAPDYGQIASVTRAVRLHRDFGRIVRNFVNFSDFYSEQKGAFQAGTLYLDARALHLCVNVTDVAKHAALATSSDSYLLYCDLKREGKTRTIAAALTNGDADNVVVGRNGIFYDHEGNDWDATVTKVIANPISIREAFWSPYKKLVKVIEDNVTKRAAAADSASTAKVTAAGTAIAATDKPAAAAAAAPKKIDLGTVAAIGVAIGGVGTLVGALLATMFGLGAWLPIGVLALLLLISGPAMMLAYLKLRRRNLGPILDANGWAINNRARVNVAFGAAMTELAKLPPGSQRSMDDPFADKRRPWKLYIALIVLVVLAGTWYVGKLDAYLPESIQATNVLGKYAPSNADETPAPDAAPAK